MFDTVGSHAGNLVQVIIPGVGRDRKDWGVGRGCRSMAGREVVS